ncbi:Formyl-coenzyme A transferase [Wickerhamomyces ciferrii]|uniref:Formyl-coenzyme A transferase n=1 Tax=Wickerhamomyces ciferrii (strain ATCC 14091 / BCRC 22168 / CBS 111 / JCM 3599 / NBRC 0793 / NRRL Y-1031 F-60-10) TaxID=1206466 RepID=K0K9R9_WICCF|nr:Formyl-coenzyme A transferase [Wickerhamomyces ciferrii]CCH41670.1 Formyl-coenzyme A transferase [Wickerhamomyces ciferrii]
MGAFQELMAIRGVNPPKDEEVHITGSDPIYKTPFKLGETTAQVLAACGVAANDLWELKTGNRQKVSVSVEAAAGGLDEKNNSLAKDNNGQYQRIEGSESMKHMVRMTQPWETADKKWFLPHTNLKHLEERVLKVLECESTVESIQNAISKRNAQELEDSIANANACGGICNTEEEWLKHPQGSYLSSVPVVEIDRLFDSAKESLPDNNDMPLSGIRVLDLTRILAGPVCGLTLAELGADVLMVTAEKLPQVNEFVRDTSHGKRSCFLDLSKDEDASKLKELVKEADIIIDGYRPDRLAAYGFGVEDLAKLRPGLIHVSINCFGSGGPFGSRAGWDQVAQAVTGMCVKQGEAIGSNKPELTPVFACDYVCGRLGAFGAMLALKRRAENGGFYSIQVSLCQAAMLLQRQGYVNNFEDVLGKISEKTYEEYQVFENDTSYGDLKVLGPVLKLSETPCKWVRKTPKLGEHEAKW